MSSRGSLELAEGLPLPSPMESGGEELAMGQLEKWCTHHSQRLGTRGAPSADAAITRGTVVPPWFKHPWQLFRSRFSFMVQGREGRPGMESRKYLWDHLTPSLFHGGSQEMSKVKCPLHDSIVYCDTVRLQS